MCRIVLDEGHRPSRQPQCHLNSNVQKVVKKEVVMLLDTRIIYPISDSEWVSPVHVMPKEGGMTIIKNERDELICTKTITGWRMCIDYGRLNQATRKDHFFPFFINQMLKTLTRHSFFCYFDGYSGFLQIPIHPSVQE